MTEKLKEKELVVLNEDQSAMVEKHMSSIALSWKHLKQCLDGGELDKEFAATLVSSFEMYSRELGKALDIQTESMAQKEEQNSISRRFNQAKHDEIDSLKKQLSEGMDFMGAASKIEEYAKLVGTWWHSTGLGCEYLFKSSFTTSGNMNLRLDISLDKMSTIFSETPVSDKKSYVDHINDLMGVYDIHSNDKRGRDYELLDTPENREKIFALIRERFPKAFIVNVRTRNASREGMRMGITGIEVMLYELA